MTTYLLAIDNGSHSTKVSVIDARGRVHASARRPLREYQLGTQGQVAHPDDDLWDSVAEACREALSQFRGDVADIEAAGLCAIRFCRALLTDTGDLTEPVLSWMDERISRPYDGQDPRVRWITTASGHLTHRLTGRFVDTSANYRGTWPIVMRSGRWSRDPDDYAATGMSRDLLVELVDPGDLLGTVTEPASAATGLPVGLPVYATANDKAAEALGSGLRDTETLLMSLGTYIAAMRVGRAVVDDSSGDLWTNFASVPGEFLHESNGIRRGMWTVSWYERLVGGDLADLNAGAAEVPPGSSGLMTILDWLAPVDHPHRRGALLGFDGSQGRHHVFRSLLEGIALTMHGHCAAMERRLGRPSHAMIVSGGGATSDLMMQIFADVFDRPVSRTSMQDAAGLGAAICAAVGSGVHPGWDPAVEAMVHTAAVFEPRVHAVGAYAGIRRSYAQLTSYTDPLFEHLYASARSTSAYAPDRPVPDPE